MLEGAREKNIFIFYYLVIQNQILYITSLSLSLALIDLFFYDFQQKSQTRLSAAILNHQGEIKHDERAYSGTEI